MSRSYSVEHSTRRDSSYSWSLWIYEGNEMPLGIFGRSEIPSYLPAFSPAHHEAGDIFFSPDDSATALRQALAIFTRNHSFIFEYCRVWVGSWQKMYGKWSLQSWKWTKYSECLSMACPAASETTPQPVSGMCFFVLKELDNLEGHFQEQKDLHYKLKMLVGRRCVFWRR